MRIISLVPSITETLFDLGLTENEIVGRTKFCIHPEEKVKKIPKIGGTKNLHIEEIEALKPDLILANKEENVKDQVEALMKNFKVMLTDVETIEDNYYLLKELGLLLKKEELAKNFNLKIYEVLQDATLEKSIKTAYLIWKNPYMTVGGGTFIHEILSSIGLENVFKNEKRYPTISVEQLKQAELILLSTEPFPFNEHHLEELKAQLPEKKFLIVDGEVFSWYGTHLAKSGAYLKNLVAQISVL